MKHRKMILCIAAASLVTISSTIAISMSYNSLTKLQAAPSTYSILIDSNTINLKKLDSTSTSYFKLRNTEFAFDKVSKAYSNVDNSIRISSAGAIYNTVENQTVQNYSITGFKSLNVISDYNDGLVAVFSDFPNGIGEELAISSNTIVDISKYSDYRYISLKPAKNDFIFDSIKIDYTCVNDNSSTKKELSRNAFTNRFNDIFEYNTLNYYDGSYTEIIKDSFDHLGSKSNGTYFYSFDLENLKSYVYVEYDDEKGISKEESYLYYQDGYFNLAIANNDYGVISKKRANVKIDKSLAANYLRYCQNDIDTYYVALEVFDIYYAKDTIERCFKYIDANIDGVDSESTVNLNQNKYFTNGDLGNLEFIHQHNVSNLLNPIDNARCDEVSDIKIEIKDNQLVSYKSSDLQNRNGTFYDKVDLDISFTQSANVVLPDFSDFEYIPDGLPKLDEKQNCTDKHALTVYNKLYNNSKVPVPISSHHVITNDLEYNVVKDGLLATGHADMDLDATYDFENLNATVIMTHSEMYHETYKSWYENGNCYVVRMQIPRPNHPEDGNLIKEYDIKAITKDQYISYILNDSKLEYKDCYKYMSSGVYNSLIRDLSHTGDTAYWKDICGIDTTIESQVHNLYEYISENKYDFYWNSVYQNTKFYFGSNCKFTDSISGTICNGMVTNFDALLFYEQNDYYYNTTTSYYNDQKIPPFEKPIIDDTFSKTTLIYQY